MAKQQPEALAEFAETARSSNPAGEEKDLTADQHTKPIPTSNKDKHQAATEILKEGAQGEHVDVEKEVEKLPDRVTDSR